METKEQHRSSICEMNPGNPAVPAHFPGVFLLLDDSFCARRAGAAAPVLCWRPYLESAAFFFCSPHFT